MFSDPGREDRGMGQLATRHAGADEAAALAAIMFAAPSREAVAMAGSAARAERFRANLLRDALTNGTSVAIVAEDGGQLVGFAEVADNDIQSFRAVSRAATEAMGRLGSLPAAWRSLARMRVDLRAPEGGVHLVELHVAPDRRNEGIGGFLLDRVHEHATEQAAAHVSLTTLIDNPARRLYDRAGYEVRAEKRNRRYERVTGSPGRVLLVKML
jgi:ribosomal protein S18 acetylase RimI-like enzyme